MKKVLAMLLALALVLCLGVSAMAEEITINFGYMANYASLWAVLTGINGGYFAEEGLNVKLTEFPDGPHEISAMEGGSIDIAYIGKGAHRLCILGKATIFAPSSVHTTDKMIVSAESGITTLEDLKGKKIGYSAGSSSESTMDSALALAGLTREDVQLYAMDPNYIVSAMSSGNIDVAFTWSPYTFQILEVVEGTTEIPFSNGSINMSSFICMPDYAQDNRDVLVRFSRALYKAMDWGSQHENAETIAQWCAEQTKTEVEANLLQWGDADWYDIATLKAEVADGTMAANYMHVQQDFLNGGNISAEEAVEDASAFVMLDLMAEVLGEL